MRTILALFGGLSLVGCAVDGLIAAALIVLVTRGEASLSISVNDHLAAHFPALYWVRDVADLVLTEGAALWVFAVPALLFFPVRIVLGFLIGAAALYAGSRAR